uniref:MD-2-related lipid-recognition domain-containing protein n=1 Tax=Romanomermis culicivorax TaxID=13658 RepID=A0A915K7B4_ROMCU
MMPIAWVLFIICLIGLSFGEENVVKYGSKFQVLKVKVDPCPAPAKICPLIIGTTSKLSVEFIPNIRVHNLTVSVYGKVMGIYVPYPGVNSNGCRDSNLVCPLEKDQKYVYKMKVHVLSTYPKMKTVIKFNFHANMPDTDDEDVPERNDICFQIKAEITDSPAARR